MTFTRLKSPFQDSERYGCCSYWKIDIWSLVKIIHLKFGHAYSLVSSLAAGFGCGGGGSSWAVGRCRLCTPLVWRYRACAHRWASSWWWDLCWRFQDFHAAVCVPVSSSDGDWHSVLQIGSDSAKATMCTLVRPCKVGGCPVGQMPAACVIACPGWLACGWVEWELRQRWLQRAWVSCGRSGVEKLASLNPFSACVGWVGMERGKCVGWEAGIDLLETAMIFTNHLTTFDEEIRAGCPMIFIFCKCGWNGVEMFVIGLDDWFEWGVLTSTGRAWVLRLHVGRLECPVF